jgi:eukaryotic-like serine/threonine-protein kinase
VHPDVRLLGGRYELTSLIATGGMGQVWRACDRLLHRDVAVKVLRSEYTEDPTFLARFRAEAQLAAGLVHPNIASLFDYGEVQPAGPNDEHLAYLVMELVRGESLSTLLRREQRLSPERTLDVLRQCAAGLAAAHAAGVVHRDVKPGNVLLADDGTVKLTDFGVALSTASVPLTQTGQVIGTPHYISPEQAAGSRAGTASDVYALGVLGYECLAGHRAFDAESPVQIALLHLNATPAPLPDDVPAPVRGLIEAALVKDPAARFPDGAAFRDAIDDIRAGRAVSPPVPTTEVPAADPAPSWTWHRRLLLPVAGLLLLGGATAGGLQLFGGQPPAAEAADVAAPAPSAPAVQLVDLSPSAYTGRPVAEVQAELAARGLPVTLRPLTTADVPDGQVIAVTPDGPLPPGTPVTVTYAVAPAVPMPTAAPVPAPDPVTAAVAAVPSASAPAPEPAPAPAPAARQPATVNTSSGSAGPVAEPEQAKAKDEKDKGKGKGNGGGNGKGNGKD